VIIAWVFPFPPIVSAVRVRHPFPPSVSVSVSVSCFSMLPTVHIMGMQRSHLGSSDKGPSQNSNYYSCNLLIDHTPLLRAASHTTSHPTSCVIFATRGALSVSAQLASSDSLPCNLQDDFLELSLGNSIPTRRSSVNLVPKALSILYTHHQAQCLHIITHISLQNMLCYEFFNNCICHQNCNCDMVIRDNARLVTCDSHLWQCNT